MAEMMCGACVTWQAGRPDMDLAATGGQLVETIVKLLCDEEASQAWNRR